MKTTESDFDLIVDYRENTDDGVIATLYGRAVPYDTPTMIGGVEETFAPASFDPTGVIGKPLAWRHDAPVGVITEAANEPDGLYITANILDTVQGRDAATLAKAGAVKGLSVGFTPIKSLRSKTGNAIRHITAQLMETSLTHMPAYVGAGITTIREETKMDPEETTEETTVVSEDKEAREAIAQVRESVAKIEARAFTSEPVHPLAQYRTFGDYSKAVYGGEVEARALFDQVTGDNPGVMPPIWLQTVAGIIDLGRPVITGVGGPQSAGTAGLDINWPYFDGDLTAIVELQADEKDEVNSVQISLEKGTATLATYAAGSDISYQLLQRSQPSYLDAHNRIMAASYSTVTDRVFTNNMWTQSNNTNIYDLAGDTTGADFRAAVFTASMEVEDATGAPASVVFASTALMTAIGGWESFYPAPYSVQNVSGVATASTLQVNVSGLRVIRAKWLDTDADRHAIVTNGQAARWIEDGPRLAQAENVGQLGRDIAIYGYGATATYLPAGVVRLAQN